MAITGANEHIEPVFIAVLPNAVIITSGLVMQRSHLGFTPESVTSKRIQSVRYWFYSGIEKS